MSIKNATTSYYKRKEEKALEALEQLEELSEEIRADLSLVLGSRKERGTGKLEERQVIVECYRDLISKGFLDPDVGIEIAKDIRKKNKTGFR